MCVSERASLVCDVSEQVSHAQPCQNCHWPSIFLGSVFRNTSSFPGPFLRFLQPAYRTIKMSSIVLHIFQHGPASHMPLCALLLPWLCNCLACRIFFFVCNVYRFIVGLVCWTYLFLNLEPFLSSVMYFILEDTDFNVILPE